MSSYQNKKNKKRGRPKKVVKRSAVETMPYLYKYVWAIFPDDRYNRNKQYIVSKVPLYEVIGRKDDIEYQLLKLKVPFNMPHPTYYRKMVLYTAILIPVRGSIGILMTKAAVSRFVSLYYDGRFDGMDYHKFNTG